MIENIEFDLTQPARTSNVSYRTFNIDGLSVGIKLNSYSRRTAKPPYKWIVSHISAVIVSPSELRGLGFDWLDIPESDLPLLRSVVINELNRKCLTISQIRDVIDESFFEM